MDTTLFTVLSTGFLLGMKHAFEPDHVIAVSTIVNKQKKLWTSTFAGAIWGIGHTATLFLIGMIVIGLKTQIPDKVSMSLEFGVGLMLIYLGGTSLFTQYIKKGYSEKTSRSHLKLFFIGLIHGLAGSAAMVLLTMAAVKTLWEGVFFILIFGMGTILGMLMFTTMISLPFILSKGQSRLHKILTVSTGAISLLFGVYYLYSIGVKDGLFF